MRAHHSCPNYGHCEPRSFGAKQSKHVEIASSSRNFETPRNDRELIATEKRLFQQSPITYRPGFTLLELMISVAIFAVTAIAIYSSFSVGITAWRKAEDSYKVRQEARHFFSIFSRDLRAAVNFTLLVDPEVASNFKDSFEGFSDRVTFWRPLKIKGEESGRIIKLTYYLKNDGTDSEGKEIKSVYRKLQTYEGSAKEEEETGAESVLVSRISDFALEYLYYAGDEFSWDKQWKKKDETTLGAAPFAVKVSLVYPSRDEGKIIKFSETIIIPTGDLKEKTGDAS